MAKSIVDGFEVVEIDENDGRGSLVSVHLQNRARQLPFEASAVEDVEQGIRFYSGFELLDLRASFRELGLQPTGPAQDLVFSQGKHYPRSPPCDGNRAPGKAHSTRRLRGVYPKASDASNVSRSLLIEVAATLSLDRPLFYELCRCSVGGMLSPSDANSLSRFLIVRIDTPSILAARVRFPRQNLRVSRIRSRSTSARRRPTNARVASCCEKSSESRWSDCMMQSLRDAEN